MPNQQAIVKIGCNLKLLGQLCGGLCLKDSEPRQREAALALVRQSLSASGFETARNVMKLNDYVRELDYQGNSLE